MKKILLLLVLAFARGVYAQKYDFETSEDRNEVECKTKDFITLGNNSPDINISVTDIKNRDKFGINATIILYKHGKESNVVTSLTKLTEELPKDERMLEKPIKLYLSNGDVLSTSDYIYISAVQGAYIDRANRIANGDKHSLINFPLKFVNLLSKNHPRQKLTIENHQIICQQLRTYDIVKIEVDGVSFDVRGLRSAATFDAMFNALAQKTGKGHDYR